jgi:hypothetical protein
MLGTCFVMKWLVYFYFLSVTNAEHDRKDGPLIQLRKIGNNS